MIYINISRQSIKKIPTSSFACMTHLFINCSKKLKNLQLNSENEFLPRRVGTSAAFGAFLPHMPRDGEGALSNSCFKSFTK